MRAGEGDPGEPRPVPPAGDPPAPAPGAAGPVDVAAAAPLSLGREVARKAIHLSSVAVPVAYAMGLPRAVVTAVLVILLVVALLVELLRTTSRRAGDLFSRATGTLLRAHERHEVSGATWLLAAFLGSVLAFQRDVAVAAMCAVALGDAAAAVIGRWLGRRRLGARKSLEGSAACLAVVYLAVRTIAGLGVAESLVAACCATLAELPERPLDDNLRMAAATGAGILLWRMAFS